MTLAPGSRFGPYEILAPLGAGGMGEVYRARDTRLGREVAVKVLPAAFSADADRLRRFEQEARAASSLNHPNILAIYDVGTHDEAPFVVSELLVGETLRERISGAALPARKAVEYAIQIAEGLAAAHEKGIVHRDLKPENLFLTKDARVKILDFGLAKLTGPEASAASLTEAPTATVGTEPGVVIGTIGYMSPEQVRGQATDHRSDIFSFGAILYEMLTGKRAFHGPSAADTMSAILKEEPELVSTRPDSVPGLDPIVRRCLEKRPGERFQSARDLAFALNNLSVPGASSQTRGRASTQSGIRGERARQKPIDSVAVLPFANASADPDADYLSDGITESLINILSQLPGLRVIARASVFRYKGQDPDLRAVARDLKVRAVVTGRMMQRGDMLSISTELVDTKDHRQLWGERYNRKFAEVLTLQEEIAKQIAENLRLRLTGQEQAPLSKRPTVDPAAYHAYLKGFHHTRKFTREGLDKGIAFFREALALDPNYAPAYAGLAYATEWLADWYVAPKDVLPSALMAAHKALELDPSLGDAHWILAWARLTYEYDWPGAELAFRRAIELNPADPLAPAWYATYLAALGRFEPGLEQIQRALKLDPLSGEANHILGWLFYFWRRYDDAIEQFRRTLELDPNLLWAHMLLGQVYEQKGLLGEAVATFDRARAFAEAGGEPPPEILAGLIRSHALAGNRAAATEVFEELKRLMSRRYVSRHDLAIVHLALGEKEQAMDWLGKAYEDRNLPMPWIQVEPRLDPLRSDPRFTDLVRRVRLPS